ncbi:hypothetical protein TEA_000031 [Camellia sinensis var. sinensis]|uniref:Amine oxidase domain-containing protein n=1 Tax=Camellia sinensis var. sinensis TaxID=542762 RepID=A0A4S4CW22_CAMSN|nr:hypothetical protein TEA_000031 [Camellia sinensis var. sinensis]
MHVKVNHHLWSVLNRKSRPQISKSTKDLLDLKMSSISSRIRIDHWNVVGNGLHSVSSEKQEKRTRNKDRPDRGVWTPLRRSDGSHASDESLSSPASQSTQLQPDSAEGSHGEVKYDLSNARSGEFKTVGTGCSGYHSLDNGSHKHGGRRGLAHNVKDLDGSSIVSEGKLLKKGGSSGYGSHEAQIFLLNDYQILENDVGLTNPPLAENLRLIQDSLVGMASYDATRLDMWEMFFRLAPKCSDQSRTNPRCTGKPEADVVVIGSGIAGLCCAGLLSRYQQDVLVLESHSLPGGATHSFEKKGYKFDSGPSLFSGLQSRGPQANPLAQVLDALGESIPCANYDSWMVYLPEGDFLSRIGPTEFFKVDTQYPLLDLEKYASLDAAREWRKLLDAILPMSAAAMALPPLSIRGVTSNGMLSAEMVYMFAEWYKPGCSLEYPIHGTGAVVDALVRGLQKFGDGSLSRVMWKLLLLKMVELWE